MFAARTCRAKLSRVRRNRRQWLSSCVLSRGRRVSSFTVGFCHSCGSRRVLTIRWSFATGWPGDCERSGHDKCNASTCFEFPRCYLIVSRLLCPVVHGCFCNSCVGLRWHPEAIVPVCDYQAGVLLSSLDRHGGPPQLPVSDRSRRVTRTASPRAQPRDIRLRRSALRMRL